MLTSALRRINRSLFPKRCPENALGTLHSGGFQHHIELHLSRTDEWAILPVRAAVGGDGVLSAQDIDGDGDTDLLWQRSLPPHVVMVWLNDGAGQFECLCPLPSFQQ